MKYFALEILPIQSFCCLETSSFFSVFIGGLPMVSSLQYYTDLVNEAMRTLSPNLNYQLESVDFSEFEKLPEVFE